MNGRAMVMLHRIGPLQAAAIGAAVLGVAATGASVPGLSRGLSAGRFDAAPDATVDRERVEQFARGFRADLAQIDGRSMFIVPLPPAPPPPPPREARGEEAPPAPSRYGGPGIIAIINGAAWFDSGEQLSPGDEARGGVRVVALDPPWGARVEWREREWDVPLFERTTDRFLERIDAAEAPARADQPQESP